MGDNIELISDSEKSEQSIDRNPIYANPSDAAGSSNYGQSNGNGNMALSFANSSNYGPSNGNGNMPLSSASESGDNLSNAISLRIHAVIEPNKPAIINEISTFEHNLKFNPVIDLVNPTAALDRLSYGINQTINAKADDPDELQDDYVAPAPKPTYGQRAKNALKGVSGLFTRKNRVAPEPVAIEDSSVRNVMQPGGRRMNTKKNRKRRITRSNRKRARPSRRV